VCPNVFQVLVLDDQSPANDELLDLIAAAIDYAARLLDSGRIVEPFTITEYDEDRHVAHFAYNLEEGDKLEETLSQARESIVFGAQEIAAYAITSVTELTIEEKKKQVILIEAASRADDDAVILAQPYKPPGGLFGFELDGPPIFLGKTTHLFF